MHMCRSDCTASLRFQNEYNKVEIELRVVQFWTEIKLVITNRTPASRSCDFVITRLISVQIALHLPWGSDIFWCQSRGGENLWARPVEFHFHDVFINVSHFRSIKGVVQYVFKRIQQKHIPLTNFVVFANVTLLYSEEENVIFSLGRFRMNWLSILSLFSTRRNFARGAEFFFVFSN